MKTGSAFLGNTQIEQLLVQQPAGCAELAETYWVNTKLYPSRSPLGPEHDPVALRALEQARDVVEDTERLVVAGGKRYSTFPIVRLPKPSLPSTHSLRNVLASRSSIREFKAQRPIGLGKISTILQYTYGWNATRKREHGAFKHVPGAGGLYPLEFYVAAINVTGLPRNTVHHYRPSGHILESLRTFESSAVPELFAASPWTSTAAAIVFITGILPRLTWKYGDRGLRYLLNDAGHAAQNACLVAEALHVGACTIVDFFDDCVHAFLDVDGMSENIVYTIALGSPAR